jgi:hypothetical protein
VASAFETAPHAGWGVISSVGLVTRAPSFRQSLLRGF